MSRVLLALMLGGAGTACAFAALGLALYAGHPQQLWALQCFAAWGAAAGLACGGLHLRAHGRPAHAAPALPPQDLHSLVRAAEAGARAERLARDSRPGSAADRRAPPAADAVAATAAATALPAPVVAIRAAAPAQREEADALTTP